MSSKDIKQKKHIIIKTFLAVVTLLCLNFFLFGCKEREFVDIYFQRDVNLKCKIDKYKVRVLKGKKLSSITFPNIKYDNGYTAGVNLWEPMLDPNTEIYNTITFTAQVQVDKSIKFPFKIRYFKQIEDEQILLNEQIFEGSVGEERIVQILPITGYCFVDPSQSSSYNINFSSKLNQHYDVMLKVDENQFFDYEIQYLEEKNLTIVKSALTGRMNIDSVLSSNSYTDHVRGYEPVGPNIEKTIIISSDQRQNVIKHFYKRIDKQWTTIIFDIKEEDKKKAFFVNQAQQAFDVLKDLPFNQVNIPIKLPEIKLAPGYRFSAVKWDNNFSFDNRRVKEKTYFYCNIEKDHSQWITIDFEVVSGMSYDPNSILHFEVLKNVALNIQGVVEPIIIYDDYHKKSPLSKWLPEEFSFTNDYQTNLIIKPNVVLK